MNLRLLLGAAVFAYCGITIAQSDLVVESPANKPAGVNSICPLITVSEIGKLGYDINNPPIDNEIGMPEETSGAPSAIQTDLCFYYADKPNSRKSVSLAIDQFEKMDGILEWLKMKNDQAKTPSTVVTELGDTTCEEGDYPFTVSKTAPRTKETTQFYVACDRIINDRRVSLSIEMPMERAGLPSTTQTKALLDLAVGRLGSIKR
jgi:hypothetical protein